MKRILWVDDRPENNEFERTAFAHAGVDVQLALSTQAALRLLEMDRYDAVISDMGRLEGPREGYVLLDALRAAGDQTPFFIYAGSDAPEHTAEAFEHGAQGNTCRPRALFEMVMLAISPAPLEV